MTFGLSTTTLKTLQDFFKHTSHVQVVKIYGSRALGNYKRGSDIDLAIYTDGEPCSASHLLAELDALPTPYLFDVTIYEGIRHAPLKEHIDRYGKTLFRRNSSPAVSNTDIHHEGHFES